MLNPRPLFSQFRDAIWTKSQMACLSVRMQFIFCQEADGGDSRRWRGNTRNRFATNRPPALCAILMGCGALYGGGAAWHAARAHRGYRPSRCTCTSCSSRRPAAEQMQLQWCSLHAGFKQPERAPLWSGSFCVGQHVALLKNLIEMTPLLAHSPTFEWDARRELHFLGSECKNSTMAHFSTVSVHQFYLKIPFLFYLLVVKAICIIIVKYLFIISWINKLQF